ncbi:5-formyltetrahydrofolate cyclo-ligase [Metasolibacillus meyeri]|uniref:5-formyltetrahydrofolate cyclo-ligase n=1 Tax=Metasolibacillus meyeri TaxID=1071052 RepID=UPI000D30A5B8|nr:5-formyltetrahydrofolate cyclo-ligase [Metasolibacillus meyeri]
MDKKTIRQAVRAQLEAISYADYRTRSHAIGKQLMQQPSIQEGKTIAVTISSKPEVDTIAIIEALWQQGKTVAVPKCHPKTREMTFYAIEGFYQLETVYMDLREPMPAMTELVERETIDTIIVPGIVFDKKGYRIGYGGGYYDRYLPDFRGTLLALAFSEQLAEQVPFESHDIPVHIILTETGYIDCVANRGGQVR